MPSQLRARTEPDLPIDVVGFGSTTDVVGPSGLVRSTPDGIHCGPHTSHVGLGQKAEIRSGGGMTHWTESVVVILLASFSSVASAQVSCDAIPHGPARTDCYLALSQFYRGQSDLAAARARVQSDAAWYRAITGTDPPKHRLQRQQ
jgi:hypothetical protein